MAIKRQFNFKGQERKDCHIISTVKDHSGDVTEGVPCTGVLPEM